MSDESYMRTDRVDELFLVKYLLGRLSEEEQVRVEDRATGLSGPRLSALSVIVFAGPVTMSALAQAEQVRPPTISKLVRDLERDGLVERTSDPGDGRIQRITATPKGKKLLLDGRKRRVERVTAALERLSGADQRILARAADLIDALARPG